MVLASGVYNVYQIMLAWRQLLVFVQFVQHANARRVKFWTLMPCLRKPCCHVDYAQTMPEAGDGGRSRRQLSS